MYLLGYDIGSSSVKAALVDAQSGKTLATAQSPDKEMDMIAHQAGWAEQHPTTWWEHVCTATKQLLNTTGIVADKIQGIGIAYQMHGLVAVDQEQNVLRPAIIWCDSRAVEIGNRAFEAIGHEKCLSHTLNSPANFTASKLKWVKENEPALYEKIDKVMLPGDYIAMRLTGTILSTPSGLSEGILWDFRTDEVANIIVNHYGFERSMIPEVQPTFSLQGKVTAAAAQATGLAVDTPVSYRAGDQPNNALSLNVLQPGEVAATGGTSGVVYGVLDQAVYDPASRVNAFAHVNHSKAQPRIGILLCINGAGIQYKWLKAQIGAKGISYEAMNQMAASIPVGSDDLRILPFGNGAERMLENRDIGASILNLQFNRHEQSHLYRAALEGIAFSFVYGVRILQELGVNSSTIKVGNDNLFRSNIFSQTICNLLQNNIQIVDTNGAVGAAKAAGVATGIYTSAEEAMQDVALLSTYEPNHANEAYVAAYERWEQDLNSMTQKNAIT
ncbi:MAG: FGGY family carbohydrate kinase [Bacteroidota bacterium]